MDLAMATAELAGVGVVNIPTSIATCAAFTCMSVMYTPEGGHKDSWRYDHEIDAVLVDLQVIADCPARYMASGILDAMAKRIEIQNGRPSISLADTPVDLFSAYRMAEYTYEALSPVRAARPWRTSVSTRSPRRWRTSPSSTWP